MFLKQKIPNKKQKPRTKNSTPKHLRKIVVDDKVWYWSEKNILLILDSDGKRIKFDLPKSWIEYSYEYKRDHRSPALMRLFIEEVILKKKNGFVEGESDQFLKIGRLYTIKKNSSHYSGPRAFYHAKFNAKPMLLLEKKISNKKLICKFLCEESIVDFSVDYPREPSNVFEPFILKNK